jgi:hypothetical protein
MSIGRTEESLDGHQDAEDDDATALAAKQLWSGSGIPRRDETSLSLVSIGKGGVTLRLDA